MAMATMNKTSVRKEVDRLKQEFEQLCSDGKVSSETRAVMNSLLIVVELILSIFLEKKTRKNSRNSSLPSSQTDKDETATPHSAGKGKGRKVDGEISNTRVKETVTTAKVVTCDVCGIILDKTPCQGYERRTKIDIVFEKNVDHVDAEIKQCPNCEATVKGRFPADMPGIGGFYWGLSPIDFLTEIFSAGQSKSDRNRAIYQAHWQFGYSQQEITRHIKLHYSTVSRIIQRLSEKSKSKT